MSVVRTLIGNIRGPRGETGATGATGPAGANGTDGAAATVRVGTTTTATYGTPASVTNSGTEEDAVFDFVIPQGAPGEEVTDASDLTLSEITASSASYPTFTAGETLKVAFGKVAKFLADLKDNYVSKAMMTTSTNVSTAGQYVADAAAVATLNTNAKTLVVTGTVPSTMTATNAYRITNPSITADMVLVNSVLGNPAAMEGSWTVNTYAGYAEIKGAVVSGATSAITLYLMRYR